VLADPDGFARFGQRRKLEVGVWDPLVELTLIELGGG